MISSKKCCTCKKNKSISNFGKNQNTKDGYMRRCRECHRRSNAEYYKKIKNLPEYDIYLAHIRNKRRQVKQKCIEYKGGKCSVCGYNRCSAALDFHHINSIKKDFKIGKSCDVFNERMKKELDKRILICTNCHRELHFLEEAS